MKSLPRLLVPRIVPQIVALLCVATPLLARGGGSPPTPVTGLVSCGLAGSTGCEAYTTASCAWIEPNYGIASVGSWTCDGYNASSYSCDTSRIGGCCNLLSTAPCPPSVCPCPH